MDKPLRIAEGLRVIALGFERFLAITIFVGIAVFTLRSLVAMSTMDWSQSETIYDLIYRVLLVVIGLELVRTLLTHELEAVIEMLAFVVARKTLKPDLTVTDILLSVIAFAILLASRRFLLGPPGAPPSVSSVPEAGPKES